MYEIAKIKHRNENRRVCLKKSVHSTKIVSCAKCLHTNLYVPYQKTEVFSYVDVTVPR